MTGLVNGRLGAAVVALGWLAFPSNAIATVSQPLEIINRPRTLPGAELEANAGVDLTYTSVTVMNMTRSDTALRAPLGIAYGVNNDFEVRVFYGIDLRPRVTGRTPLDVRLAYSFFRQGPASAAAQVRSGVDLGSNTVTPLRIGINAQYNFSYNFAVFTPGEQLVAALSGTKSIDLNLPVGVGYQATPQIFGSLTTNLARIGVANSSSAFILRDMIPVDAALFFSPSSALDLGAHFDIDLKNTNRFTFGVLARLFV